MKFLWCILISLILISHVCAYERYMQGSDVYVNETIDVTSVTGWAESLAYYNGWDNEGTPSYILELPYIGKQTHFYIDPQIFSNRTGYWYQYYGANVNDNHGFTKAFRIVNGERNVSTRYSNGTINFNTTYDIGNHTKQIIPPPVPTKHVSDYLIARGNDLTIKTSGVARVWLFGPQDGLYNLRSVNNTVYINNSSIQNLRVGDYKIVIQTPGNDGEFNVVYNSKEKVLNTLHQTLDSWEIEKIDVSALSNPLLKDKLIEELDKTNDGYSTYNLVIEDPMMDIISQDEFDLSTGNILQVGGYTNSAAGTRLCFGIDEKIHYKSMDYKPTCVLAQGDKIGDMRYFIASVPFKYNDLSIGTHFITGTSDIGGSQTTSFYVYSTFDDKPKNSSLKYIAGNLFVPTPTPEIIKVVETQIVKEVVTQVIEVQLTPNLQELYETNKTVQDTSILQTLIGSGCVISILYIASVLLRGRRD